MSGPGALVLHQDRTSGLVGRASRIGRPGARRRDVVSAGLSRRSVGPGSIQSRESQTNDETDHAEEDEVEQCFRGENGPKRAAPETRNQRGRQNSEQNRNPGIDPDRWGSSEEPTHRTEDREIE